MSLSKWMIALIVAFVLTGTSAATGEEDLGTRYTDLWWNPNESGWGVTVDHQRDVMFLTFFVYGSDHSPYWVTALLSHAGSDGSTAVFSGEVFETRGPSFGSVFDPGAVAYRLAGTATFVASGLNAAKLTYSIDGVDVSKDLQRQTLHYLNLTGAYVVVADIRSPGYVRLMFMGMNATQNGSALQLVWHNLGSSCTFAGQYSQHGAYGQAEGHVACAGNPGLMASGAMTLSNIQWTTTGMTAMATQVTAEGSEWTYRFAAIRGVDTP